VLLFTKTGKGGTSNVWFYDMTADGYSLDDKRQKIENDDIPNIISMWKNRKEGAERKRTDNSFQVPVKEIRDNGFDLSINKYKETVHTQIVYLEPKDILLQIKEIEREKEAELKKLEELLK
jgi:type I restriction enzyme M protein